MAIKQEENLKQRLFGVPQYNEVIKGFKDYIQKLNYQQRKLLKRGRYHDFYHQIQQCVSADSNNSNLCFKQKLHKECGKEFEYLEECMKLNKQKKNDCNQKLGEYFICIDRNMKHIYLSSTFNF